MWCLCVAGAMTECLFRRGVCLLASCLWEVKNEVFVCG